MNRTLLCLTVFLSTQVFAELAPKITRTWKSKDGRELVADLIEYNADEVRVKRAGNQQMVKIPLQSLSEEDRRFVLAMVKDRDRDTSLTKGPYAENIKGDFVKMKSKQGLNYQLYGNPKWDSKKRFPLVIWLHGSGQSGADNQAQMSIATKVFTDLPHQKENPCFMIAPQCPDASIGWDKEVADNLMQLINDLCENLPIDQNRLYLTGSSMGGSGSFRLAAKYPEVWAAVVPLCGGGDPKNAEILKSVPIWAFHGSDDLTIPPERTRKVIEAITAAGGTIGKYTELKGEGHNIANFVYVRDDLHAWMFAQSRAATKKS